MMIGEASGVESTVLRLVSTGQALVAELLRLSDRVPAAFHDSRYAPLLFDLRYLKSPELFEQRVEANDELLALDEELRDAFLPLLERFYLLFHGIVRYHRDLLSSLDGEGEGHDLASSALDTLLDTDDGRQLLVEALLLHGLLFLLLEHRIPGSLRERLLVAFYRNKGGEAHNFDAVCSLCRAAPPVPVSGMAAMAVALLQAPAPAVPSTMLTVVRPEELFARFPLPKFVVLTIIERLRGGDIYNAVRHFPRPEHRTTALSAQAGALLVLLFYAPQILRDDLVVMREIVDRYFRGCWIVPVFLGFTIDLSQAWDRFKAAKAAMTGTLALSAAKEVTQVHASKVLNLLEDLRVFLLEGVLTQDYVLKNMQNLLFCLRECNVTLRWLLLQRTTGSRKLRDAVLSCCASSGVTEDALLSLLLNTSALEFELKRVYGDLLHGKEARWKQCKAHAAECMLELSDFFSGSKVLSKKVKDENLQLWFSEMAAQVQSLDCREEHSAGRKIQHMFAALREVEQFHQIEGSLQAKQYLSETKAQLQEMVRTLGVQESMLATISVVSDASYSWGLVGAFTSGIHSRIRDNPLTIMKLQCLFLKLRCILDTPLQRISQCGSADLFSVSEYYSSELVAYVRAVLEVIPISMFAILDDVITVQTQRLRDCPARLVQDKLRDYAQQEERYALVKATHRVAVFTQGIMSMKKTFIGAIELDPRQLLEDGIRKQLVKQIASALDSHLVFTAGPAEELEEKLQNLMLSLQSQRRSMEYFQDYVHIHGLQVWQEEFTRIVNYNLEQECSTYLKRKNQEWRSLYQSRSIPIPDFPVSAKDSSKSKNFMGRVVYKLLQSTHPSRSMYLSPMSGWFDAEGKELVGLRTFTMLQASLGPAGMMGIDRLLSFDAAKSLQQCLAATSTLADWGLRKQMQLLKTALTPPSVIPDVGPSVYAEGAGTVASSAGWTSWVENVAHVGQLQLLRCLIASHIRAASKVDSSFIAFALEGMNSAVLADISLRFNENEKTEDSWEGKVKLVEELSKQLQMCGVHNPLSSVYLAAPDSEDIALLLLVVTIAQLPRYVLDSHLGTLTSRMKKAAIDCCPLVVGVGTLLRQVHPSHTAQYVQYLGQYIRTHIENISLTSSFGEVNRKSEDMPTEVTNAVAWLLALSKYAEIPQELVESWLPSIVLKESFIAS